MPRLTLIPKKFFIILVSFFAFTVFVGYLLEEVIPQIKDKKSLPFVKSIHLDEATIAGTNIPPVPNEAENNATLLGVDSNKNYIRDDVELAIYAKYASSTQERVALLGYAQALEMRYRVSWKEGHQYVEDEILSRRVCIVSTLNPYSEEKNETAKQKNSERSQRIDGYNQVVNDEFVYNTSLRNDYLSEYYKIDLKNDIDGDSKGCPLDFTKIK